MNIFYFFDVDTVQVTPKSIHQRSAALSVLDTYFVTTFKALLILVGINMAHKAAVFRKEHFNAAHRLHNPTWSDEKNEAVFGKCNNPHFHGHNYELIVQVTGEINPDTGYVVDMKVLSSLIKEFVLDRFDHRNLNLDVEEFFELNPSAENIAVVIYNILRNKIDQALDLKIRLYETERNFVEYPVN